MQILTSMASIDALRQSHRQSPLHLDLVACRMHEVKAAFKGTGWDWDPEEHGAFVFVEQGDNVRDFGAVGLNPEDQGLVGATWEVCFHHIDKQLFEVFILYGNDTGWTFFVPDEPWLDGELRARLLREAEPVSYEPKACGQEQPPF